MSGLTPFERRLRETAAAEVIERMESRYPELQVAEAALRAADRAVPVIPAWEADTGTEGSMAFLIGVLADQVQELRLEVSDLKGNARHRKWAYVIESLTGGLDDAGVLHWIQTHGPGLDHMVAEAERLRDGMIAT